MEGGLGFVLSRLMDEEQSSSHDQLFIVSQGVLRLGIKTTFLPPCEEAE